MSDEPVSLTPPQGYAEWLAELKARIHTAQQRATLAVNRELVLLYWNIGRDVLARQAEQGWGAKVIDRLAKDLRAAFPEMKGFSPRNLKYMRAFADAWPEGEFVQAVLAQLPWYHQLALLDKLPSPEARRWYAAKAIEHNWSRNVLVMQIETQLLERTGQAVTNFRARSLRPSPTWPGSPSRIRIASTSSGCCGCAGTRRASRMAGTRPWRRASGASPTWW